MKKMTVGMGLLAGAIWLGSTWSSAAQDVKLRGDGSVDDTQPGLIRPVPGAGVSRDNLNAGGVKLRGDGSVDDTQPRGNVGAGADDSVNISRSDERTVTAEGGEQRARNRVQLNPVTGNTRERTETRTENADGTRTRVRTEVIRDADGNLIGETTRTQGDGNNSGVNSLWGGRSRSGGDDLTADGVKLRGDGSIDDSQPGGGLLDRPSRGERPERAERAERAERPERAERAERADRPERAERAERADRPERAERADRPERNERAERAERPERADRAER